MAITIQVPPWESQGTLPPEGMRKFVPGHYAKAAHMNALMYRNYQDHVMFQNILTKYGTAVRFFFDDLKTIVGREGGVPPGRTTVIGMWPVWVFRGVMPLGLQEEVFAFLRFPATEGEVRLQWTTFDPGPIRVVWGIGVHTVGVGGPLEAVEQIILRSGTSSASPFVRNETVIRFGPLPSEDLFVGLRIFRDAHSSEDSPYDVGLFGLEVVIV